MKWLASLPPTSRPATFALSLVVGLLAAGCVSGPKHFNFHEAAPGVFVGSVPRSKADFAVLHQHGIRTVLSLQCLPWIVAEDRRLVSEHGMIFRHVYIPAWPWQPSERRVKEAVLTLRDESLRPIFVHCYLGHDRTALIMGLYRIYYENWSPDDAWAAALRGGFKVRWALQGLRIYFWRHCEAPEWARKRSPPKLDVRR